MSSQIPEPPPSAAHAKADSTSLGDLLGDVTRDLSTLMRQEIELAKAELKQSGTKAGKGGGMLARRLRWPATSCCCSCPSPSGTPSEPLMGLGWSAVVVAIIWGIIAAVLASMGRKELKKIQACPRPSRPSRKYHPP